MWKVIQVERKKLDSRCSLRDKLGRELIAGWSFKKKCNGTWTESKCCRKEKECIRVRPEIGPSHDSKSAKGPGERGKN